MVLPFDPVCHLTTYTYRKYYQTILGMLLKLLEKINQLKKITISHATYILMLTDFNFQIYSYLN